jgi:tetratricopeptide (TPR) repeat protein
MHFTFAELLRSYRERASLEQAALAAALGVHRNTISIWERGQYRPRDRETVLRLAAELALTPVEADQLLRAADFPGAYSALDLQTARHQLRPPVADFVGRTAEAAALVMALQTALARGDGAVIGAIHGMGGIGKTELAYQIAQRLRTAFPDALLMVDLRGSSAAPLTVDQALQVVIRAFANTAKLPDDPRALQQIYRSVLHKQRVLILADDARDAAQVQPLIPPLGCALLITSRARFTLPGMDALNLEPLGDNEAVRLLCTICNRLGLTDAQVIARACGNLPLALRVSAGIVRNDPALPVAAYTQRLANARQCLTQLHDPDDPQLDVEASLTLSYALLDDAAQRVFRQLGVLVADFAMPLALAVVEAPEAVDVAQILHLLLRRNLIMYDAQGARWRLHDLVRAMALRQLMADELTAATWRYARTAIQVAQSAHAHYLSGEAGVLAGLAQFDLERPHIDAARHWAAAHAGTPAGDTLLLADAAATLYIGDLRYDEQRERIPQLEHALAAARRLADRGGEGIIVNRLGIAYYALGDARTAISYHEQSLANACAIGDRHGEEHALGNLGLAYRALGEIRRAIAYYEQSLAIARVIADQRSEGTVLNNLGGAYVALGDIQRALFYLEQSLAIARMIGNRRGEGFVLNSLGNAYYEQGDLRQAIAAFEQSLAITREINNRRLECRVLSDLGRAAAALGDMPRAITTFEQALATFREIGDRGGEAECSWHFGLALASKGTRSRALPLLRACVAYEAEIGHAHAAEHAMLLAHMETEEIVLAGTMDQTVVQLGQLSREPHL